MQLCYETNDCNAVEFNAADSGVGNCKLFETITGWKKIELGYTGVKCSYDLPTDSPDMAWYIFTGGKYRVYSV